MAEDAPETAKPAEPAPSYRDAWPVFARAYPDDPELAALVDAFARGDFGTVRVEAPKLAAQTKRDEVARAARELREKIEPDPLAIWITAGAGLLLLFLVVWFYLHKP